MKLNTAGFLHKGQFPLMLALGTLPVTALLVLHNVPQGLGALNWMTIAYVLLAWLCILLPGKFRVPACALGCAGLMAMGLILLPAAQGLSVVNGNTLFIGQGFFALLAPVFLCALLIYSLQFGAWPRDKEIPFNWYAAGVFAHLFVLMAISADRRQGSGVWAHAAPMLTGAFIVFMLLVLLSMNRLTMQDASLGRQTIPLSMRRRNSLFTAALLALALFITAFPAIARFVERACLTALQIVGAVIAFIASLLEQDPASGGGGAGGGGMFMPSAGDAQPGLFAKIMETVAILFAYAVLAVFTVYAVWTLGRKVVSLLRILRERIARYMSTASQDYIDEITDTREENGESSGTLLSRLRRSLAFVNERRLSPAERIRYRYRLLLRRHPDWQRSQTARESLPQGTAALYEKARYSGQPMTAEQAEQFAKDVKNA